MDQLRESWFEAEEEDDAIALVSGEFVMSSDEISKKNIFKNDPQKRKV